jgi:hypothetical protein
MNDNFVPYIESLELRKIGFDEDCFGCYNPKISGASLLLYKSENFKNSEESIAVTAPLWQQAFRWFREKHNLHGEIVYRDFNLKDNNKPYYVFIINKKYSPFKDSFETYDDAQLACLQELIQIIKNK